jgi:hypothetical protein
MKNHKSIFNSLNVLNNVLLHTILIISCILLLILYSDPILCNGKILDELKPLLNSLTSYAENCDKFYNDYKDYSAQLKQARELPERLIDLEWYLGNKSLDNWIDDNFYLHKIRITEAKIKSLDSNFISTIKEEWTKSKILFLN